MFNPQASLKAISEYFGVDDLYAEERHRTNQRMLQLEPKLRRLIEESPDPLRTALTIAAAANTIDFGVSDDVDVVASMTNVTALAFAHGDTAGLARDLARSKMLLYLVDNSGGLIFYAEDIHTGNLQMTNDEVNALIGSPAGTPLPSGKSKWQVVIEKLNEDLELIPFAYGPWQDGQDPATAKSG